MIEQLIKLVKEDIERMIDDGVSTHADIEAARAELAELQIQLRG